MSKVIEYPIEVSKINQDTNMSGRVWARKVMELTGKPTYIA